MTGTRRRVNLGYLIDNIWSEFGDKKPWEVHPFDSPMPHAALLELGERVISYCRDMGVEFNPRMDDIDHDIWLRAVGAWVCYLETEKETRSSVAHKINIDASNLTNFINGKRAITANALTILASLFGIQPFDLRPDLGADYVANLKKENERKLSSISKSIAMAQGEIDSLHQRQHMSLQMIENNLPKMQCANPDCPVQDMPNKIMTLRHAITDIRDNTNLASELIIKLNDIKETCV